LASALIRNAFRHQITLSIIGAMENGRFVAIFKAAALTSPAFIGERR
jgi:hypothetical protein